MKNSALLLDGSLNGCGGEQIAVQVRDSTSVIGSTFADSAVEGFDCVSDFEVEVPRKRCYEVVIDRQPVGRYARETLPQDGNVGVITAKSAYGEPESLKPPMPYLDFRNC